MRTHLQLKNTVVAVLKYQKDKSYNSFCSNFSSYLNSFFNQNYSEKDFFSSKIQAFVIKGDDYLELEHSQSDFLFIEQKDIDVFLMKLEFEINSRKKYSNKNFRPLIVINQGKELIKFEDSYKYNIYTINFCSEFSINTNYFNLLKNNSKPRLFRFNFLNQFEDSFIMENSILISHNINHKTVYERIPTEPKGFKNLSIEEHIELLKKKIITYQDIKRVNASSDEECISLLEAKNEILKSMR